MMSNINNLHIQNSIFNQPLPNDKILDMPKLKAFADDKLKVDKMTIFLVDRVEDTEGKGENAGYQHFSFSLSVYMVFFFWGRGR